MIENLFNIFQMIDKYMDYLNDKIQFSDNGYPIFEEKMFLKEKPDMIITYANRLNKVVANPLKTAICFFDKDSHLYPRIEKVFDEIPEYKKYMGVIGIDVTITKDMSQEWQKFIILLNQLHLAVLACNGIKIIANLRVGDKSSLESLKSYPQNVICASGFLGCKNQETQYDFSYIAKILTVRPSNLLIYGKQDKIAEQQLELMGINYCVYPDFHRLSKGVI